MSKAKRKPRRQPMPKLPARALAYRAAVEDAWYAASCIRYLEIRATVVEIILARALDAEAEANKRRAGFE